MTIGHSLLHALATLALLASVAVADLSCTQYVPKGSKGNRGQVNFSGSSGSYNVASINAQVANPVFLDTSHPYGTQFHFQSCNSTSLGLGPFVFEGDCDDAGCYNYYFHYIRIISPLSGDCLESRALAKSSNVFKLVPKKCNSNPTNASQLFLVDQEVVGPNSQGGSTSYGPAYLYATDALGPNPDPDFLYPYDSWYLAADNKTILYHSYDGSETSLNAVVTT